GPFAFSCCFHRPPCFYHILFAKNTSTFILVSYSSDACAEDTLSRSLCSPSHLFLLRSCFHPSLFLHSSNSLKYLQYKTYQIHLFRSKEFGTESSLHFYDSRAEHGGAFLWDTLKVQRLPCRQSTPPR
ncbi:unnamed protein product, partial [Ectocarpus sp. 12 AP-2014]